MENEFMAELRQREINYQAYWQSREFLQWFFKIGPKKNVSEEFEEIFDFQTANFVKAFHKEFLKKVEDLKAIEEMAVTKKVGKVS